MFLLGWPAITRSMISCCRRVSVAMRAAAVLWNVVVFESWSEWFNARSMLSAKLPANGFLDEVEGAGPYRLNHHGTVRGGGHRDAGKAIVFIRESLEKFEPLNSEPRDVDQKASPFGRPMIGQEGGHGGKGLDVVADLVAELARRLAIGAVDVDQIDDIPPLRDFAGEGERVSRQPSR